MFCANPIEYHKNCMQEHEVPVCKILDSTALLLYFHSYHPAPFAAALAHCGDLLTSLQINTNVSNICVISRRIQLPDSLYQARRHNFSLPPPQQSMNVASVRAVCVVSIVGGGNVGKGKCITSQHEVLLLGQPGNP